MTQNVMQTRVSVAKAASGVHRLTDMLVEEVSLVDRAANQRKFLIVKRDTAQKGSTMATEVTPNGKGGFTAAGAAAKSGGDEKDKTKKSKLEKLDAVPPGFKQMMAPLLSKASERLQALADAVDKAPEGEVDDEGTLPSAPADFSSELSAIIRLLDQACNVWPASAPDAPAEGEAPPEGAEAPPDLEMREKMVTKLAKGLGFNPDAVLVRKVGAKMSKERLSRFEAALDTLGSLLGELRNAPPAPAAKSKSKDEEEDAEKRLTQKMEVVVDAKLKGVLGAIEKLTSVVVKQKDELANVRKARPSGNSLPVEETTPVVKSHPEDVSWPLDMNSKYSRDKVNKAESFFDDD